MLKLSITHQTWLLSFALTLVLVVLVTPLVLNDNELDQAPISQISEKISTAFYTGGINNVEREYAELATNVYVGIKDQHGNFVTSNLDKTFSNYLHAMTKAELDHVSGKSSVNFLHHLTNLPNGFTLYVAIWQAPEKQDNPILLAGLFLGSVTIAAVLSLIWGVIIRRRLQSINQLTSQIIRSGDVSLRLPSSSSSKDFNELECNLNSMLSKIETLMEDARSTGDAIAHDLRAPLTRLKGKLEMLSSQSDNLDQQLHEAHQEIDHIVTIFNALLRLSILESGKQMIKLSPVAVSTIVQDVVELYEPLADDKKLSMEFICHDAIVNADKQLLFQAICNVVDNAVKFAPEGSKVSVVVENRQHVHITVADSGAGVTPANINKLTERFFRGDESRTLAGTGLGLSLVKAVITLHQGQLEFADNHPGLIVTITLPKLQ